MYALPIVAGLLGALPVAFLALLMAGAGHGWTAPLWFSLALFVLYPAVAVERLREGLSLWPGLVLAGAAIAGDVLLVRNMVWEEPEYFRRVGGLAYLWLGFWIAWQAVLAASLAATLRRRALEVEAS